MELDFVTLTRILSAAKCWYEQNGDRESITKKLNEIGKFICKADGYDFILIEKPF